MKGRRAKEELGGGKGEGGEGDNRKGRKTKGEGGKGDNTKGRRTKGELGKGEGGGDSTKREKDEGRKGWRKGRRGEKTITRKCVEESSRDGSEKCVE